MWLNLSELSIEKAMATATAAPSVPDPSILEKIQDNLITSVQTKETVPVSSLWKDTDVVIMFLRRFG